MRADCSDPENVVTCGCTVRCLERTASAFLDALDRLPTEEAKRAAVHRLNIDLKRHQEST